MANTSIAAKAAKGKKMNPNVSTETTPVDPSKITKTVTKKVKNPFTGKTITREGIFELPAAHGDIASAYALCGNREDEVIFWFNQGRLNQARLQMNQALDFDLGSDTLNELFDSFQDAMDALLPKEADEKKRKRVKDFILSEEKFQPLVSALETLEKSGLESIAVTFGSPDANGKINEGETELKKPTGVRGRRKKVSDSDTEVEVEETEE